MSRIPCPPNPAIITDSCIKTPNHSPPRSQRTQSNKYKISFALLVPNSLFLVFYHIILSALCVLCGEKYYFALGMANSSSG
jgi:hypothetical protein